jgi:hypothetical protein
MSILSPDTNGHLTITAPGATALVQGDYTVAILFRNLANLATQLWYPYESDNFAHTSLYFDGDVWVGFNSWDSNYDIVAQHWRWLVVSKASGSTVPEVHVADYTASGGMTWAHNVVNGAQANFSAINRISIGDEFGSGLRGEVGLLTAFTSKLSSAQIEATFVRSSAAILAASPQFFVHFPFAAGIGSAFSDLAGGGSEIIRSGSWSASADPTNFDFVLTPSRTGKVKRWNGTTWDSHPVKVWNGTSWDTHMIKGYDGSSWVTGK